MKKTIFSISAALLLSGALAGCGTNNNAANRNNGGARPIGYHTGPGNNGVGYNNRLNRNNNVGMGNNFGAGGNGNASNNGANGNASNNGANVRGNTAANQRQARVISRKLTRMKNIQNVSVVVTKKDVLIGVKSNAKMTAKMKSGIRRSAKSVAGTKKIHVTANPAIYRRISNVSNNLQNGNAANEASSDVRGIINDLANAVKRPFQNNVNNR